MDVLMFNMCINLLKNEKARVLERLNMYFSVVLKEEAIRITAPSGI